jgi:hypothetical protein
VPVRTPSELPSAGKKQDGQCTYNVTLRSLRENIVTVKNQYTLHICVCVCVSARVLACACTRVALLIQRAIRMRHVMSFVAVLAPPYFSMLSHKWHDFREKMLLDIKYVLIFSRTFV